MKNSEFTQVFGSYHPQEGLREAQSSNEPNNGYFTCSFDRLPLSIKSQSCSNTTTSFQTRQALFRGCNEKWVDELLDGVVLLLDACGIVKDVLLQFKEHIQGLQSMFRRRKADELEVAREISDYLASRKKAIKLIQKTFKDLKANCSCSTSDNKGDETIVMADM
ncbi:hypothetical protein V6N13_117172 [Hibiscus sabdariffa]|uniref:Uncharacterized protein n=1 Tax=Hibiscus sabdariffa TaxID=183260 RepID=A0ABR1Z6U8_9ROSI